MAPTSFIRLSLTSVCLLLTARSAWPAGVELRQIVSREHPVFVGTGHGLAVGRDGSTYVYNSADGKGYVLRVSLDGSERFGGQTVYAITGLAVNKEGRVATSNAHFAKSIHVYDRGFRPVGKAEGFTGNDDIGWDGPGNVEAGASGEFYALDQHAKHRIGARHYIRYVDDFILLHESPQWLNAAHDEIEAFLPRVLHARLNPSKTILQPVARGVDFVGHVIKPWHTRTRSRTVTQAIERISAMDAADIHASTNSYFGLLRQSDSSHTDRAHLAKAVMRRGHCVNKQFTKTYRRSA